MLIGFLGAPCSGKTTTAAKLFANFKDMAIPVEFVTEYARFYIATKRNLAASSSQPISLADDDQYRIAMGQELIEDVMVQAAGSDGLVVTDTSVLNSLLYMSKDFRESQELVEFAERNAKRYDIIFYSNLVPQHHFRDPNRLHTEDESKALNQDLEALVQRYFGNRVVVPLAGPSHMRLATAIEAVLLARSTV